MGELDACLRNNLCRYEPRGDGCRYQTMVHGEVWRGEGRSAEEDDTLDLVERACLSKKQDAL